MATNSQLNLVHEQASEQADVYQQSISVTWNFPIVFTRDIFSVTQPHFKSAITRLEPKKKHNLIIFVDEGVVAIDGTLIQHIKQYCQHFASSLNLVCDPVLLPGGERIKNEAGFLKDIQESIFEHRLDRHSHVVAIGGGALLDAVGLAAATAHRGIRHTRIPTTVLAQNDSGVGVKNGVNHFAQKNYMGTFTPPFAVINDYLFIEALPVRDKVAGMAEAVKVALIRDAEFFNWLESNVDKLVRFDPHAMQYMIKRCAELHMRQISHGGDPFEAGSTRPLDFGHWSAHKLEIMSAYKLRHGEAVAIGIALDVRYSVLAGLLPAGDDDRITNLLEQLGFNLWQDALLEHNSDGTPQVVAGIDDFREHLGGELTITLLQLIGTGVEVNHMDKSLILEAIDWLLQRTDKRASV